MADAFIINGLRTFIGLKNKAYKNIPAEDLVGEVLGALKLQNSALGNKCTNGNCRKLHKRRGRKCFNLLRSCIQQKPSEPFILTAAPMTSLTFLEKK